MFCMKSRQTFLLAIILLSAASGLLHAQKNPLLEDSSSFEEVRKIVEPYYQALKNEDWALVSVYCALTAHSKPQRFYLDSDHRIDKDAKWQFLNHYRANYTDPATGVAPDECRLVVSVYQVPGNSTKLPQGRMDLWLRTNDKWFVIPEQEISHRSAIQINNVPLDGRGIGAQFESLVAIEGRAREDREQKEKRDAIMNRASILMKDVQSKTAEVLRNENLTDDQKQAAIRQVVEAARAAALEGQKDYEALDKAYMQNRKPTRTYTKPK